MRLILLLLPWAVLAQDWGGLHMVNGDLPLNGKMTLQLHTRLRTNENFSDYFQTRGGPILFYKKAPRLTLVSGYYFIDEETQNGSLSNFHRMFGGLIWHVPTTTRVKLEARSLVEQFIGTRSGNFVRVRERLWLTYGQRKLRPYAQVEGFLHQGIATGRFGVGGQLVLSGGRDLFFGYEFRQQPNGTTLQLITSNFQFRLGPKRE
jgi:hypothetical protein